VKITFLSFEGCPNTPAMLESLQKAVNTLDIKSQIERLNIYELAERNDIRAGYGSPTILVNGKDLFGAPIPQSSEPTCRFYGKVLPGKDDIASSLCEFREPH
jgi:hypothetical protein